MGIDIYKLELNEEVRVGPYFVTRVPGGWIYNHSEPHLYKSFFIPYTPKDYEYYNRPAEADSDSDIDEANEI